MLSSPGPVFVDLQVERGAALNSDARLVDAGWVRETTGIAIADGRPALYEGRPAGHINPRRLVDAQCRLAARAGATLVEHAATELRRVATGIAVGGTFTGDFNETVTGQTNDSGVATLTTSADPVRRPSFTFCVDGALPNASGSDCRSR